MSADCPYCRKRIDLRPPRPGRHELACSHCSKLVALSVPNDLSEDWVVTPVAEDGCEAKTMPRARPGVGSSVVGVDSDGSTPNLSGTGRTDTPSPADDVPALPLPPPAAVPGYRLDRVLGHGGMGTVYLAWQLSLDRPVALKLMGKRWSADPVFIARFVREAYAAALLNHPNVVQIHDIGESNGQRFFCMEYVPGRSLAHLVKNGACVEPEEAVGYVLQAARGLKHAHDRGLIHRDVKPDNLLVTDAGLVKVADLGLVKTPEMTGREPEEDPTITDSGLRSLPPDMTGVQMALGTPAYMAPEQCRDAATVDHRADIYSLGCTLYVLVTGKPPFDGTTAVEVMARQAYEPLVPPDQVSEKVPKGLSAIVQKMMAKEPGDRYATMGEVVRVLEDWLGTRHAGPFTPGEKQVSEMEKCARVFRSAPAVVVRHRVVTAFMTACPLAAIACLFERQVGWAFGLAAVVLQAAAFYFVLNGAVRGTYFFRRVRQFAGGMSVGDWTVTLAAVGLLTVLVGTLGFLEVWAGAGVIALFLAVAVRVGLARAVDRQREEPIARCEKLLHRLRLMGMDEEDLRLFVAKYAGRQWEEFFEAMFGYEAKLATRAALLRLDSAGPRETFAAWREPVLGFINRVENARKQARERQLLEQVEWERLVAGGQGERAARYQAAEVAAAVVDRANEYRAAEAVPKGAVNAPTRHNLKRIAGYSDDPRLSSIMAASRRGWRERALSAFVGPVVRAVLAAVCVGGFLTWVYQNGLFADPAAFAPRNPDGSVIPLAPRTINPLRIEGVPPEWTAWCNSANVGWAGVLLLASLFYRGNRTGVLALAGAAVTVFGREAGIGGIEPVKDTHVAMSVGTALAVVGCRLGRR